MTTKSYEDKKNMNSDQSRLVQLLSRFTDVPKYVKTISDIGIDFSVIGKNKSIGKSKEDAENDFYFGDEDITLVDTYLPYSKKEYKVRIANLRTFASNTEIENILENVANEAIVYDEFGNFCDLKIGDLKYKKSVKNDIERSMKSSYRAALDSLKWNDGQTAWDDYYNWLIDGTKIFEFCVDNPEKPKKIVAIQELEADSVVPYLQEIEEEIEKDGKKEKVTRTRKMWKQIISKNGNAGQSNMNQDIRTIPDNLICVVSFSNVPGFSKKISYTERLLRSFNLMRIMEDTKAAWVIMNSQHRMKLVIPIGSQTKAKAKQTISKVTSKYKEDLYIDSSSGDVTLNGQPRINYAKTIILPKRQGDSPDIQSIATEGPDMQNMDVVKYFEKRLQRDSKQPASRYDSENGGGIVNLFKAEGVPYDEVNWFRFINRTRKEFEKPIRKFIYIQLLMDMPDVRADYDIESKIGLVYDSNFMFEAAKIQETLAIKSANIDTMSQMTDAAGNPIYSKKWLYTKSKWAIMTEEEWAENVKMRNDEISGLQSQA